MEETAGTSFAAFSVSYSGAAVEQGEMDVRLLAPALLSLGDLFNQANEISNPERSTVSLRIRATERGSFSIEMDLVQIAFVGATVLGGSYVTAAVNLKGLIVGGGGVLDLIRRLKGQTPQVQQDRDGSLRLTAKEIDLTVPPQIISLLNNPAVRRSAQQVVNPLSEGDIDALSVVDEKGELLRVTKAEHEYFTTNLGLDETITDTEFQMAFKIARLAFNERSRWRLTADGFDISAEIKDQSFWASIHNNSARFSEGDILVCRIRARQRQVGDGEIEADYEVMEVIRHVPAGSQLRMLHDDETE